jgi:hypothetical protein
MKTGSIHQRPYQLMKTLDVLLIDAHVRGPHTVNESVQKLGLVNIKVE